jgi:hypothetical protein
MSAHNAFVTHASAIEKLIVRANALSVGFVCHSPENITWRHVGVLAAVHEKLCDAVLVMGGVDAPPVGRVVR